MLKRILCVSIALLATIVALVIYWIAFMPWLHLPIRNESWIKLGLAVIGMVLAIYWFARWRSWPTVLFLLGSIPVVLVNISMVGWEWRIAHDYSTSPPADDRLLAMLFPSDNEHSAINTLLYWSINFSALCLAIVFFCYFFRVFDWHLTKRWSEPLTD